MKRFFAIVAVFLGFIIVSGCSPKKIVQPSAGTEQKQDTALARGPASDTSKMDEKKSPVSQPKEFLSEKQIAKAQPKESVSAVEELQAGLKDIHFAFDKYDITPEAQAILKEAAAALSKNIGARLMIEGHCDERGTNEYNLGLGDKRTNSVKDYLVSLGVPSGRLETISYGEEKPACNESTGECWAKNRRAHFVLVMEKQ